MDRLSVVLRVWLILSVVLLAPLTVVSQQRNGSIRGQVTDPLGALVVGASVTLTSGDGGEKIRNQLQLLGILFKQERRNDADRP